ncbi:src-like-adapter [Pteropus vampyrus]|uniref:Src-like-adapter n=1 Tax=Pteropus vampyrus TaxID=132908 RepID=A0A6P3QRX3_PTEVA|nr:src-like-adapter [Pteropus vampyrus]
MYSELGHPSPGGLGAWLTLRVYPLCRRLRASSTARGLIGMGNSVRSSPPPPERPVPCPDGLDSDFLAVLSDYPSPDISPPIFRCGEKLRVISELAPDLNFHTPPVFCGESVLRTLTSAFSLPSWLFEGLGRDKAEELLQLPDTKIGSFMIRESETKTGLYSLSVRHRQVKHYRIFRLPNNWYYISPRLTFQCLEDLVNHYSEVADGLCCVLTTPCLTQSTATPAVRAPDSPVALRQKTFDWRRMSRLREDPEGAGNPLVVDESLFSYGLRESIASYLSLTSNDSAPLDRKKKSLSLMYSGSKRKSSLFPSQPYFED